MEEREYLLELFHESGNAWLRMPKDVVPDQVRTLIDHEQDAEEIITWSMILVPGLAQTPDYGYIVTERSPVIEAEDVPAVAAARAARASILEPGRKCEITSASGSFRGPQACTRAPAATSA